MGYLLKEALKTLCGVNQWSYAIFWKIGCQNPKLIIWEECYYEPVVVYSNASHGVQAGNKVHLLVTKMMKDNYINLLGEGLVGRVAFTKNHQWITSDNKMLDVHPPEVSNEVCMQFSAGIQTIAVIPVHPHGVVQLGSSSTIIENMGFVNDVKSLISQLGCVPGALLSANYMKNEGVLDANSNRSAYSSGKSKSTDFMFFTPKNDHETAFGSFSENYDPLRSMDRQISLSDAFLGDRVDDSVIPCGRVDEQKLEHELFQALTMSSEEIRLRPPSRDDLFDVVGMDFKAKLFDENQNFVNDNGVLELQGADSGIYSLTASDHLLDAVVSSSKQISDDNMSCRTSSTKTSSSSGLVNYSSPFWANGDLNLMKKTGVTTSYSYKSGISKEDGGNFSETSSIISSQIGSWSDQKHDARKSSGFSSDYAKRADEMGKSNRKRLKPGENPRPRPKDRQMIQDRVKELREIVPNCAKCSIDALLERTIKHMLFLQSVTKHADKLKQTGESKIVSKEGGLLLRDNFEGGATWAYEVGSQSMVCPIIVEDLNSPRQMLVEMLCEERGLFLEIADIVKGLGLTILKGVMESRKDKIWAHFTVEANRDVTRMEIFISLVSLFEQAVKNDATSAECGGNENVSVRVPPRRIQ